MKQGGEAMEDALKAITSPAWWVGVVIVGLLINLVAAYLKPRLDQAASSISVRWATRTDEQRRQRLERIQHLRGDVNEQLFASFDVIYALLGAILLLIGSMFLFMVLFPYRTKLNLGNLTFLLTFPTIFTVIFAQLFALRYGRIRSEIREAQQSEGRHNQANA
jgi:hypothetical protein